MAQRIITTINEKQLERIIDDDYEDRKRRIKLHFSRAKDYPGEKDRLKKAACIRENFKWVFLLRCCKFLQNQGNFANLPSVNDNSRSITRILAMALDCYYASRTSTDKIVTFNYELRQFFTDIWKLMKGSSNYEKYLKKVTGSEHQERLIELQGKITKSYDEYFSEYLKASAELETTNGVTNKNQFIESSVHNALVTTEIEAEISEQTKRRKDDSGRNSAVNENDENTAGAEQAKLEDFAQTESCWSSIPPSIKRMSRKEQFYESLRVNKLNSFKKEHGIGMKALHAGY